MVYIQKHYHKYECIKFSQYKASGIYRHNFGLKKFPNAFRKLNVITEDLACFFSRTALARNVRLRFAPKKEFGSYLDSLEISKFVCTVQLECKIKYINSKLSLWAFSEVI